MIRTDIPLYASSPTEKWPEGEHCLQMCLKMMLSVLMPDRQFSLTELEEITHKQPDAGAYATHHLIWMVDQGLEVQHWDTHDWPAFRDEGLDYIRRTMGDDAANYAAIGSDIPAEQAAVDQFLEHVPIVERKPHITDMEKLFSKGWLLRAGVNSRVLNHRDGYVGHSVVITGFEADDVVFHDPDVPGTANRHTSRELFQAAMDSFGGEIDAVRNKSIV
jgi:hypothetical protein